MCLRVHSSLSLSVADAIVCEALRSGREHGMKPLTVVVCDAGGHMVAMKREDGRCTCIRIHMHSHTCTHKDTHTHTHTLVCMHSHANHHRRCHTHMERRHTTQPHLYACTLLLRVCGAALVYFRGVCVHAVQCDHATGDCTGKGVGCTIYGYVNTIDS